MLPSVVEDGEDATIRPIGDIFGEDMSTDWVTLNRPIFLGCEDNDCDCACDCACD